MLLTVLPTSSTRFGSASRSCHVRLAGYAGRAADGAATGCDFRVQPQYVFAALDASAASYRLGALARDTGA
jgi:hypothetical protein